MSETYKPQNENDPAVRSQEIHPAQIVVGGIKRIENATPYERLIADAQPSIADTIARQPPVELSDEQKRLNLAESAAILDKLRNK